MNIHPLGVELILVEGSAERLDEADAQKAENSRHLF